MKGSTSSTWPPRRRLNVHEEYWLPHNAPVVGNIAALVPHKGQRYLVDAAAARHPRRAGCAFRDPWRGGAARGARAADPGASPGQARAARRVQAGSRSRCLKGDRCVRHELGDGGARHVAARRDGMRQAGGRHEGWRHPGSRRGRGDRPARSAARRSRAGGRDCDAASGRRARGHGWARPGWRACARASAWSGWCGRRSPSTRAWPAHAAKRTPRVPLRPVEPARVHHSQVAHRKIVFHGIVWVQPPQRLRDLRRHVPPGRCHSASVEGTSRPG